MSSWESGVEFAISVTMATKTSSEALTMSLLRGFKHRQRCCLKYQMPDTELNARRTNPCSHDFLK